MIKTYDKDIISDSQEWGVNKRDKGRFLKGDEVCMCLPVNSGPVGM